MDKGTLQKLLDELAANPSHSIHKVCKTLGITPNTAYYHLNKPEISVKLREVAQATLKAGSMAASNALVEMASDTEAPHNARVNASKAVMEYSGFAVNPDDLQEVDSTTATPEELAKLMQELNKKLGSFTDEIAPKVINPGD
jgi:hypothetical protein